MKGRDYDNIFWGFGRQNFDDYDNGEDDLSASPEDMKTREEQENFWDFDLQKFFKIQENERGSGSQFLGKALRFGTRTGAWTVKQGWNVVSPTLRRTLEGVPGWGPQIETETDEALETREIQLEQLKIRLERRLDRTRQQLEEIRGELARRRPPSRRGETPQDKGPGNNSSDTDLSML